MQKQRRLSLYYSLNDLEEEKRKSMSLLQSTVLKVNHSSLPTIFLKQLNQLNSKKPNESTWIMLAMGANNKLSQFMFISNDNEKQILGRENVDANDTKYAHFKYQFPVDDHTCETT